VVQRCHNLNQAEDPQRSSPAPDMAHWFRPTAATYFSRIGKANILAALREAKGATAPAWEKGRKADLAVLAEQRIAGIGWLPVLLRGPAAAPATDLKEADLKRGRGRFRELSGHGPSLRRVVLNRQGILAARARLSTGRPLHRLRRRAGRLTQIFLRPF
jgi:hypothetical protein